MTAIIFVNVCKELKTAQINQVNELFQFKITCVYRAMPSIGYFVCQ